MKKIISLMLVAAVILLWSNALAKERPGAAVVLSLKDGRMLKGELYAVKADAVIIVDAQSESATVAAADITRIELKKRIGRSIRTGAIIGFGAGAVTGIKAIAGDDHGGSGGLLGYAAGGGLLGLMFAVPGALAGWIVGKASRDRTFMIEGLSGEPLRKVLYKLSKYARAPNLR
jgi:hypothetical protein